MTNDYEDSEGRFDDNTVRVVGFHDGWICVSATWKGCGVLASADADISIASDRDSYSQGS